MVKNTTLKHLGILHKNNFMSITWQLEVSFKPRSDVPVCSCHLAATHCNVNKATWTDKMSGLND